MKKQILIPAIVVAFSLSACSGNPGAQASSGNESKTAEAVVASDGNNKDEKQSHETVQLTKADFLEKVMNYEKNQSEWVFEGDKPALIDFYADWCGPCKITSPILEELAVEYGDKIDIYKIDTDEERELAQVFGIQGIPSFLFIPMEGRPTMTSGIQQTPEATKQMFRRQIDEFLLN